MIEGILFGVIRHTKNHANKIICQIINVAGTNVVDILLDDFQPLSRRAPSQFKNMFAVKSLEI